LVVSLVIVGCGFAGRAAIAAVDMNSFDELLTKATTYDFGQSREDLTKISEMIRQASVSPQEVKEIEKRLCEFVKSKATYAAKQFVCRELSLIGTEASVPAMAEMLPNEEYSDMARYALERIPGGAVDQALRDALPKAAGKAKVGIINTLAVRKDAKASPLIVELINDSNEMIASAAVAGLGRIGDSAATEALAKAMDKAKGTLRTEVLDAYLKCADALAQRGDKGGALAIYEKLYSASEALPIRTAALRGKVAASGDKATEVIVSVLKSNDQAMQTAAIGLLREVAKTEMIKQVAAELPRISVRSKVQLLSALADCGDKAAMAEVVAATKDADASVKAAALSALGVLGDVSTVDLLVQASATASGAEQNAARESLSRLRGEGVDKAILDKMAGATPEVKVELIRALEQRNVTSAVATLLKETGDADNRVRVEAIKALRTVAGPGDIQELVNLLMTIPGIAERGELEKTVVAVARKIPEEKGQAAAILAALPSAKDLTVKSSLLSVLGRIGDPAGLPILKESLEDKDANVADAAVRALSDWPSAAPAEDLLKVAQTSTNPVHKVLALRGYVRLIGLESDRPKQETVNMYKQAMDLAPNEAEKKMVLSGLATVRTYASLEMAAGYLGDEGLRQEAEAAIVKIAEATLDDHPQKTKDLLKRVADTTKNSTVKEQAQRMLKR
jgi:HEAT repeat protein